MKGEGLFGTLAARSKVKTTSSAVKGEPSWNLTPGRSLNSHTVSLIVFHAVARAGTGNCLSSLAISGSKMCAAI